PFLPARSVGLANSATWQNRKFKTRSFRSLRRPFFAPDTDRSRRLVTKRRIIRSFPHDAKMGAGPRESAPSGLRPLNASRGIRILVGIAVPREPSFLYHQSTAGKGLPAPPASFADNENFCASSSFVQGVA